jgi:hypothetical protein
MKRLILTTVAIGFMAGSVAMAMPYIPSSGTISGVQNGSSYSDGGQFTATVGSVQFQTFCIEVQNEFAPGESYGYNLGQTTHNDPSGASPLKLGTAWLFNAWNSGAFGGTHVNGQYNLTSAVAGELQAALWYFQSQNAAAENSAFATYGYGAPSGDAITQDALTALGGSQVLGTGAYAASAGAYGVSVIEQYNLGLIPGDTTTGQDWLYQAPDGGMTVALLGGALVGLQALRRKLA